MSLREAIDMDAPMEPVFIGHLGLYYDGTPPLGLRWGVEGYDGSLYFLRWVWHADLFVGCGDMVGVIRGRIVVRFG